MNLIEALNAEIEIFEQFNCSKKIANGLQAFASPGVNQIDHWNSAYYVKTDIVAQVEMESLRLFYSAFNLQGGLFRPRTIFTTLQAIRPKWMDLKL
jgi:hypothetical protein